MAGMNEPDTVFELTRLPSIRCRAIVVIRGSLSDKNQVVVHFLWRRRAENNRQGMPPPPSLSDEARGRFVSPSIVPRCVLLDDNGFDMSAGSLVTSSGRPLFGREREREVLDRLLDDACAGVVVLHGEAGVGKTALLDYAVKAARVFRVVRASGVEAEMELPYAAGHLVCSPFFDLLDRLPPPQREALGVAFGLTDGPPPDPFLVGLAVLGLLSEAAVQQPLLVAVDDAHWLDHASARALSFVARRLSSEPIALVFATRQIESTLRGLPDLLVLPLGHRDARAMLESVLPAPFDESVLERIVVETRGNPLALLELPRGLSATELAGGFGLPATLPLSAGIEKSLTKRLSALPEDARRLLLVAAADPVGEPSLVWRAAERLGIPESAADTVESEELLQLGTRVVVRHPLVRSAVYRAATSSERRAVHHALGGGNRPGTRPGSPRLAPSEGGPEARRGGCGGAGGVCIPSAGARRVRRRRGIPGPGVSADSGRIQEIGARARGGTSEIASRGLGRRPPPSCHRRGGSSHGRPAG